jgi:hypothetical protein
MKSNLLHLEERLHWMELRLVELGLVELRWKELPMESGIQIIMVF